MVKKILRCICVVLMVIVSVILSLATIGMFAQAAGLVDDTISAENLYSKYPLINYQLDFYMDTSKDWMPWNWGVGIGKNVLYGIYSITNFLWIVGLYLSNATGYVVEQAYKLDFINDMADAIGKNIQTLAGVNEHGFQNSGYYVGFLLLIVSILGIYVTYVGLFKRETSKAIQSLLNFVLIFIFSVAFIANAPSYIKKINEFSSDISVATLDLGTKIIIPGSDIEGQNSVSLIRDCLFSIQVRQPWILLQFGDSDESKVGKDKVDKLLSISPIENFGKDRENIIKEEVEKNNNSNLTITGVVSRLGMVAFLFVFNAGISLFVLSLSGYMIMMQVLFMMYAMLLPISFVLALIPTYNGNIKKTIEKLFNVIMMRAGITLIVTIAFSISTMFYNMTTDYPFFMIAFLQIVVYAGVTIKLNDLMSMFNLNSNDGMQMGRRFIMGPRMFFRKNLRRVERKVGRSIEKGLTSDKKRSSPDRINTKNESTVNVRPVTDVNGVNRNNDQKDISRIPESRNHSVRASDRQNRSEKEGLINENNRASELRPNVKTMGEKTVTDEKKHVNDTSRQAKEKVKDVSGHKVRENIAGIKRNMEIEPLKQIRELKQETYYQNIPVKRNDLRQERERKDNRRTNIKRERTNSGRNTGDSDKRGRDK